MTDIINLGTFASLAAVWARYPEGGKEGEYLTINGVRYRWDKYNRVWTDSYVPGEREQEQPAIEEEHAQQEQEQPGVQEEDETAIDYPAMERMASRMVKGVGTWLSNARILAEAVSEVPAAIRRGGFLLRYKPLQTAQYRLAVDSHEAGATGTVTVSIVSPDNATYHYQMSVLGTDTVLTIAARLYALMDGQTIGEDDQYTIECGNLSRGAFDFSIAGLDGTPSVSITASQGCGASYYTLKDYEPGQYDTYRYASDIYDETTWDDTEYWTKETGLDDADVRLLFDTNGDSFLTTGETLTVTCSVLQGFADITEQVQRWTIARSSGDAAEDAAWSLLAKAVNFQGTIVLDFSDLGRGVSTIFTVIAYLEYERVEGTIEI